MPPLEVHWIGSHNAVEMRAAWQAVSGAAHVSTFATLGEQLRALDGEGALLPDLMVLAQQRPGEHALDDVERTGRALPLVRVAAVLGSWCEGETRTGRPWPGVIRLYWHQAAGVLARELQHLREGRCSAWALPLSATRDERLLAECEFQSSTLNHEISADAARPTVGIYSASGALGATLSGLCHSLGFATATLRPGQRQPAAAVPVVLWDVAGLGNRSFDGIARRERDWLSSELPHAAVIALLGFPRWHDLATFDQLQLAGVVSKPIAADDLRWQLLPWVGMAAASQGRV